MIKIFRCRNDNCDFETRKETEVNRHRKKKNNSNHKINTLYKCVICNNEFNVLSELKTHQETCNSRIENKEGLEFLTTIEDNSIDLILTDPPYVISIESGMNTFYNNIKKMEKGGNMKNESDWQNHIILRLKKIKKGLNNDVELKEKYANNPKELEKYINTQVDNEKKELEKGIGKGWSKENFLKYGNVLGKKYATQTNFGKWDEDFTMDKLELFLKEYYKKLKNGGTLILWFDLWKISYLKALLEKYKFKTIRLIEWIKTNPQPINQKISYLSNAREIALLAVKGTKPVFNPTIDENGKERWYKNGTYNKPMSSGKCKFHPTSKNLELFEELIELHTKEGMVVLDTFLGGGTTALACKNKKRKFLGCELSKDYYDKFMKFVI
jgi:DNA modification methylase